MTVSLQRGIYILVDHFSRYAFILCAKGQTAREMITLIDSVHKRTPIGTLLTDQYGGLSSDDFRSYCSELGIRHVFAAVDSAFSMGLNERLNQTIVNRIRCAKHDETSSKKKLGFQLRSNVFCNITILRILSLSFLLLTFFLESLRILYRQTYLLLLILLLIVR